MGTAAGDSMLTGMKLQGAMEQRPQLRSRLGRRAMGCRRRPDRQHEPWVLALPIRPTRYQICCQLGSFIGGLNFGRKEMRRLGQSGRPVRVPSVAVEAVQRNCRRGVDGFQ